MGELFERIKQAVREERFIISDHADEMYRERRILVWQVIAGIEAGRLVAERSR